MWTYKRKNFLGQCVTAILRTLLRKCVILCFRVLGEGKLPSAITPEDRIAGKPIFYSAKDNYLLSATTDEDETFSVWIELHRFWSFLLGWL
jgi:hypothetical protein